MIIIVKLSPKDLEKKPSVVKQQANCSISLVKHSDAAEQALEADAVEL